MTLEAKESNQDFLQIYRMIAEAKAKTWSQINKSIITLYWEIGQYISNQTQEGSWGKSRVEELSRYILTKDPSIKGFSSRNLWRMKQFYEAYHEDKKLSALLTEVSWSNHLHILSKTGLWPQTLLCAFLLILKKRLRPLVL
ncbi:DUF1016 N-terminal domain-containing protein [Candidatus Odyssella thessalonicensis]|uniref:DUF1016 N-terminal domain-containing protein n=1 Tax=Candidatus Odyssella thessalonicensis TaxID=84647 RepID=UPI000225A9E2|nr:DUF1016 N-terminal domain-containing protein [Candidatus Odyssella thessalonicensis]